jgi:hypothetical protein
MWYPIRDSRDRGANSMPHIGEIRYKNANHRHIWVACEGCGKKRWVRFLIKENRPRSIYCPSCSNALRSKDIPHKPDPHKAVQLRKNNPYMTLEQIAKLSGYRSGTSIVYQLRKLDLPTKHANKKAIETLILRADNPCMSLQKISDKLGSNTSTVWNILNRNGIPSKSLCANKFKVKKLRKNNPSMTLQSIGDQCGLGRERVRQILVEANLPTKSIDSKRGYRKLSDEQIASLLSDRQQGMSYPKLSLKYNISLSSVYNYITDKHKIRFY